MEEQNLDISEPPPLPKRPGGSFVATLNLKERIAHFRLPPIPIMEAANGRFRPLAIVPFLFSCLAFALILLLVLSGTTPGLIGDAYLLKVS